MDLFQFSMSQFQVFLLIFSRVGAMLYAMPVISGKSVPHSFRIGLAMMITLILIPISPVDPSGLSQNLAGLTLGLMGEVMIGIVVGFTARVLFAAVEMAGELAGLQMGLSVVNVLDPERGTQVPILGQFYSILAMLIFLSLNAHYLFLKAIGESFILIPPFHFALTTPLWSSLLSLTGEMFSLAVQIAAPVIVAAFVANVALNILSRSVPQMNILVVGFPITIAVGFLMMALSMGLFGFILSSLFQGLDGKLTTILSGMRS